MGAFFTNNREVSTCGLRETSNGKRLLKLAANWVGKKWAKSGNFSFTFISNFVMRLNLYIGSARALCAPLSNNREHKVSSYVRSVSFCKMFLFRHAMKMNFFLSFILSFFHSFILPFFLWNSFFLSFFLSLFIVYESQVFVTWCLLGRERTLRMSVRVRRPLLFLAVVWRISTCFLGAINLQCKEKFTSRQHFYSTKLTITVNFALIANTILPISFCFATTIPLSG